MKNTLENKDRFFAQYWGQMIAKTKSMSNQSPFETLIYNHDLSITGKHKDLNDFYIVLKPLHKISLEDAIDVAKVFHTFGKGLDLKIRSKKNPFGEHFAQLYFINKNVAEKRDSENIVGNFSNSGLHSLKSNRDTGYLKAFDLLRSKGYAVPFMGLDIEKLIKFNWIKLQE